MQDMSPQSFNKQKQIATINDISGYGRCSMAVTLPIISTLKVQCSFIPTSIFSNHSGYPSYYFHDFTDSMEPYINEWKKRNIHFDGIYTGFLGSEKQIEIVQHFIDYFKEQSTIVIVDPVMGDYGKAYATYTQSMCQKMKQLITCADILTPNMTEACILTDTPYKEQWKLAELMEIAKKLSDKGPKKVVLTGFLQKSYICNFCYEKGKEPCVVKTHKVGTQRPGTGDVFASIIAADAVNGVDFKESVKRASGFVKKCIVRSIEMNVPTTDGVCFEEVLHTLKAKH